MVKGTSRIRASVWARSVLPTPVGPMRRMFDLSSSTSDSRVPVPPPPPPHPHLRPVPRRAEPRPPPLPHSPPPPPPPPALRRLAGLVWVFAGAVAVLFPLPQSGRRTVPRVLGPGGRRALRVSLGALQRVFRGK